MSNTQLKYAALRESLFEAFPELVAPYRREFADWTDWDTPPGNYVLFGLVVVPYLLAHLSESRDEGIQRLFEFFEEMAASDDPEIVNLVKLEVIKKLLHDPEHLRRAREYLKPRLRRLIRMMRK